MNRDEARKKMLDWFESYSREEGEYFQNIGADGTAECCVIDGRFDLDELLDELGFAEEPK